MTRRFHVDRTWTRPRSGEVVLGGSPLTLFRLTPGGRRIADALEAGEPLPTGHEPLTDRLLAAGAIHPDVATDPATDLAVDLVVDVIVPVRDEDPVRIASLVRTLRHSHRIADIVIVDDGSAVAVEPLDGARVERLAVNGGPARARNEGVRATSADTVLFVDADITFESGAHAAHLVEVLCRHLVDERVAVAAPRVVARPAPGVLASFDTARSPLDLGDAPARVRALSRVSYVPAAALLVRRRAFVDVGGFDPTLRFGEDVDLVWRFDEAGWRCRYEPVVEAQHEVRPTWRRWLRQRRDYGTSAAPLARRHRHAVAPLRMSRWSMAAWLTGAVVHPLVGLAIAGGSTVEFARRLGDLPDRTGVALRCAGLGHLHAGRLLARALTRTWWPLAVVAALLSRRARRAMTAAALLPALAEWWTRRPPLDPLRYVALSLADDVAYGTGVWIGCWRAHDRTALPALLPDLTP